MPVLEIRLLQRAAAATVADEEEDVAAALPDASLEKISKASTNVLRVDPPEEEEILVAEVLEIAGKSLPLIPMTTDRFDDGGGFAVEYPMSNEWGSFTDVLSHIVAEIEQRVAAAIPNVVMRYRLLDESDVVHAERAGLRQFVRR
jgi:hypothetical protein